MTVNTIKQKLAELNFHPKKMFGQHFLINQKKVDLIISNIKNLNPFFIMEVGPGLGVLTEPLLQITNKNSNGPSFCAVELDAQLCEYWKNRKVRILEGDILKIPWQKHLLPNSVLVGNLPYQAASRLMIQCCPGPNNLQNMVLMFQKEVAQRIRAASHNKMCGLLSVLSRCYWDIQFLTEAGVKDFYPAPKVAGQVLLFKRKKHCIPQPNHFLIFVKHCFSQRRKFLINQLKQPIKIKPELKLKHQVMPEPKEYLLKIFNELKLSPNLRPEQLKPSQFVTLYQKLI